MSESDVCMYLVDEGETCAAILVVNLTQQRRGNLNWGIASIRLPYGHAWRAFSGLVTGAGVTSLRWVVPPLGSDSVLHIIPPCSFHLYFSIWDSIHAFLFWLLPLPAHTEADSDPPSYPTLIPCILKASSDISLKSCLLISNSFHFCMSE